MVITGQLPLRALEGISSFPQEQQEELHSIFQDYASENGGEVSARSAERLIKEYKNRFNDDYGEDNKVSPQGEKYGILPGTDNNALYEKEKQAGNNFRH